MKAVVGFFFFLLFLAGIALVTLQGRQLTIQAMPDGGAGIAGVTWRANYIGAEKVPDDAGINLEVTEDGGFKGHGGCNHFFGSLQAHEGRVRFDLKGTSKEACPDPVGQRQLRFFEALEAAVQLHAVGQRMVLTDAEENLLIEFRAAAGTADE